MGEVKAAATIGGAPISWVALMGALLGGGTIIPLVYYIEGGGYHSLSYALIALNSCILGPYGGAVAAIIGGIIAMFLAPGAASGQLWSVLWDYAMPALMAGFIINRKWKWCLPVWIGGFIVYNTIPWYWPGPPAFPNPPQPFYFLSGWWDYLSIVWLLVLGRNIIPEWIRSDDKKKMAFALAFLHWTAAQMSHLWGWSYWVTLFVMPPELVAIIQGFSVPWERAVLMVVSAIIGVPVLRALKRSGLRRIPTSAW